MIGCEETSITKMWWSWKVCELAKKDSENGIFRKFRNDVKRFLTIIIFDTIVVSVGAIA